MAESPSLASSSSTGSTQSILNSVSRGSSTTSTTCLSRPSRITRPFSIFLNSVSRCPHPASLSPLDIQAAATKAAAMEHLSMLDFSSLEVATASDELGEIIELPSLEGSFDSAKSGAKLALADSGDWRLYPPWRVHDFEFWGYYTIQTGAAESAIPVSFESLTWDLYSKDPMVFPK